MILSLTRSGIASGDLEKSWAAYRKQNGLDLHGNMDSAVTQVARCIHPEVR